jgi:flagellar hook-associated protein 2
MGSAISFTGSNGIDWNQIIDLMMQQESRPLTTLQTSQQALQGQTSAFKTLSSKITSLQSVATALTDSSTFVGRSATVTDSAALTITPTSATPVGSYDIKITELARAQVTRSSVAAVDRDQAHVASTGTLTIGGVPVVLTGDYTLDELSAAVNATENIGVVASVVYTKDPNTNVSSYELVLTGKATGEANAFVIDPGATGLTFAANSVTASNASAEVNNITVTSATNTIENAIPGATLTLLRKDATATISATVSDDTAATKAKLTAFVNSFNDLMSFTDTQASAAANGDGKSIGRDSMLRGLRTTLRETLLSQYSGLGSLQSLSEIGIEFQRDGKLKLNDATFADMAKTHLADAASLVGGTVAKSGVFDAVSSVLHSYTDAGGLVPSTLTRVDDQSKSLDSRITALQARLAVRRVQLQQQMYAADSIMTQLNSQKSTLNALSASYSTTN